MSTSVIEEDTAAKATRSRDFLDMFADMTEKKLPSLPSIPRESHLSGIKNYRIWKERMLSVLDSYELRGFVTETVPEPDPEDDDRHYIWSRINGKVRSFIINNCKDDVLSSVLTIQNAKEMWDKLSSSHDRITPMKRVSWEVQLRMLDPAKSSSMREHISKMEVLRDRIVQAGGKQSEEDMAITLLSQLPVSYSVFYTSLITSGRMTVITWDELVPQVLDQEDRNDSVRSGGLQGRAASATTEALAAQSAGARPPRPRPGPRNQNVQASSSPAPRSSARASSSQQRTPEEFDAIQAQRTCNNCGQKGHYWRKCPNRRATSGSTSSHVATMSNPSNLPAYVGTVSSSSTDDLALRQREWIIDSGAARHMTPSRHDFSEFTPQVGTICFGDSSEVPILGEGTMNIIPDGKGSVHSSQVIYCPKLSFHLLSVFEICKLGKQVLFDEHFVSIMDKETGEEVRGGFPSGGIYKLHALASVTGNASELWHFRFGHLHADAFRRAFTQQMVVGLPDVKPPSGRCIPCIRGKQHREAFPKTASRRATVPLELVHTDLCGPMAKDSLGGSKYFMLLVDDCSRFMWVYFLARKSEALSTFVCWRSHAEKESGYTLKAVRSDHGSEFTSHGFVDFCSEFGIRRELANVGTPSENGVVERKNQTVVEMARTLLEHRSLPRFLWAESVATAVHILNRAPTSAVPHKTPYEAYFGRTPSVAHLRIFGCDAYAHVPKKDRSKFDAKSRKLIHVGYNSISASYRLYDPEHRRLEHSRDVIFDESSVLEAAPRPEGDTTQEPTLSNHSDDLTADSSAFLDDPFLQDLPRKPRLEPVPPVPEASPVREQPPVDFPEDGGLLEDAHPEVPEVAVTDPGMRSDFLIQEEDAEEELELYPKWLIQTLKDSGVTDFTTWNET